MKPQAKRADGESDRKTARSGTRRLRLGRVAAWAGGVMAVVVLTAGTAVLVTYEKFNGNIHSADISNKLGDHRPVDLHQQAQNIMVVGSDSRAGTHGQYGHGLTTAQSDTLMIVHIAANRTWAAVVSIPRDSWVPIPACDEGNGQMSAPHSFKINEAFALGSLHGGQAGGAACTIKTLEQDTGVHIDHFVSINFEGFKDMVDALGGVEVCTPRPIDDPKSHLVLPAGKSVIKDEQALAYVRARYTLGDGSDLGRIGRQQSFLSSLIRTAKSKLYDPAAMYGFLNAVTKSLTTDSGLGSLSALYSLANSVTDIPTSKISFVTVPTYPRQLVVPTDRANVLWKQPLAGEIFAALRDDTPISDIGKAHTAAYAHRVPASRVRVRVLNATGISGKAALVARELRAAGFVVIGIGDAPLASSTVVDYPADGHAAAVALAGAVPGAVTEKDSAVSAVTLVIGADFSGVTADAAGGGGGRPTRAASPVVTRNAAQNICAPS